jgi:hypothetical protein
LEFIGDAEYYATDEAGIALSSTVPTISSNDKFAYGIFPEDPWSLILRCDDDYQYCPSFSAFIAKSNGQLEQNKNFTETDPVPQSGYRYDPFNPCPCPNFNLVKADPSGHLAVLISQNDGYGGGFALVGEECPVRIDRNLKRRQPPLSECHEVG